MSFTWLSALDLCAGLIYGARIHCEEPIHILYIWLCGCVCSGQQFCVSCTNTSPTTIQLPSSCILSISGFHTSLLKHNQLSECIQVIIWEPSMCCWTYKVWYMWSPTWLDNKLHAVIPYVYIYGVVGICSGIWNGKPMTFVCLLNYI
jgi:hypothetical protein